MTGTTKLTVIHRVFYAHVLSIGIVYGDLVWEILLSVIVDHMYFTIGVGTLLG